MKRFLAMLLCAAMLLSMSPLAYATAEDFAPETTAEEPGAEPTEEPIEEPAEEPLEEPIEEPVEEPTEEPTPEPTEEPVEEPTPEPTEEPIEEPTPEPTEEPIEELIPELSEEPLINENPAATETPSLSHDCAGELEEIKNEDGAITYYCPVCGAMFDENMQLLPSAAVTSENSNLSATEQLQQQLNSSSEVILDEDVIIDGTLEVPENCHLIINGRMTIDGSVNGPRGHLANYGEVTLNGIIDAYGLISNRSTGTITVRLDTNRHPNADYSIRLFYANEKDEEILPDGLGRLENNGIFNLDGVILLDSIYQLDDDTSYNLAQSINFLENGRIYDTNGKSYEPTPTPTPSPTPTPAVSGTCGENLTWALDEAGTLTISGTGAMVDYTTEASPWDRIKDSIYAISINPGVTSIGSSAFHGCSALTNIDIPEGITSIGQYAFSWCGILTSVDIPDSVTNIGNYAFSWCSSLTEASIPNGVTNVSEGVFQSCTNLASVSIPETVISIGDNAFSGCTALSNVHYRGTNAQWEAIAVGSDNGALTNVNVHCAAEIVSSGACGENLTWTLTAGGNLTIDGSGAMDDFEENGAPWFANAEKITAVSINSGVTSIGSYAFQNCTNLGTVYIPASINAIGDNAFIGAANMVWTVQAESWAEGYAYENSISYAIDDLDGIKVIFQNKTSCSMAASEAGDGAAYLNIQYVLREDELAKVSDANIVISLPSKAIIDEASLLYNGVICNDYSFDSASKTLYIPVSSAEGEISLSFNPNAVGSIESNARICYKINSNPVEEVLAVLNTDIAGFDLNAYLNENTIIFSGLAPANSEVSVYVDNEFKCTCSVSSDRTYSGSLSFPEWPNKTAKILRAECTIGDVSYKKSVALYYKSDAPTLIGLKYYDTVDSADFVDLYALMNGEETARINYTGNDDPFKITVAFTNPSQIGRVYIVAAKNNIKHKLQADYDESLGEFVACGYFEDGNKRYSPDYISVEYTLSTSTDRGMASTIDIGSGSDIYNYVQTDTPNSSVIIKNEVIDDHGVVSSGEYSIDADGRVLVDFTIKAIDTATGINIYNQYKNDKRYLSYVIPGLDEDRHYLTIDTSDPTTLTMFLTDLTDAVDTAAQFKLSCTSKSSSEYIKWLDYANDMSNVSTVVGIVDDMYNICKDTDSLRNEVYSNSALSDSERTEALRKVDELESDKKIFSILTTALPLVVAASGGTMAAPAALFSAMISAMGSISDMFYNERAAKINGKEEARVEWNDNVSNTVQYINDIEFVVNAYDEIYETEEHEKIVTRHFNLQVLGKGKVSKWIDLEPKYPVKWVVDSLIIGEGITEADCPYYYRPRTVRIPSSLERGCFTGFAGSSFGPSAGYDFYYSPTDRIPDGILESCKSLKSVDLSSAKEVGSFAFRNCSNLTRVTIPESVTYVGERAFEGCSSLTYVKLPGSITTINAWTFKDCTGLTSVNVGPVREIGTGAFQNCSNLQAVLLPETLKTIGNSAFEQCSSLTNVNGLENTQITRINKKTFFGCSRLAEVTFPESLTGAIGESAFEGCTALTAVNGGNVRGADASAFRDCESLKSFTFGEGTEFYDVSGGHYYASFGNCRSLKKVEFSEGIKSLGGGEFIGCESLEELYFPASLQSINVDLFESCGSIKKLTFTSLDNVSLYCREGQTGKLLDGLSDVTVYYPDTWWTTSLWYRGLAEYFGGENCTFVPFSCPDRVSYGADNFDDLGTVIGRWISAKNWDLFDTGFVMQDQLDSVKIMDLGDITWLPVSGSISERELSYFKNLETIICPEEVALEYFHLNDNSKVKTLVLGKQDWPWTVTGDEKIDFETGITYSIDMSLILSGFNIGNITRVANAEYDKSTGIAVFDYPVQKLTYYCDTGFQNMEMEIEAAIEYEAVGFEEDDTKIVEPINNGETECFFAESIKLSKDLTLSAGQKIAVGWDGILCVPPGVTLRVPAGASIELNHSATLYVMDGGKLIVDGTIDMRDTSKLRVDGTYTYNTPAEDGYHIQASINSESGVPQIVGDAARADAICMTETYSGSSLSEVEDGIAMMSELAASNNSFAAYTQAIYNGLTLSKDTVIPKRLKLQVYGNISIPAGVTLVNRGEIDGSGYQLKVSGGIENYGTIRTNVITAEKLSEIYNAGVIFGTLVQGNGRYYGAKPIPSIFQETGVKTEEELRVKISEGESYIPLSNNIALTQDLVVPKGCQITLSGGNLEVTAGVTLTLENLVLIESGALIVERDGCLVNNSWILLEGGRLDIYGTYKNNSGLILCDISYYRSIDDAANELGQSFISGIQYTVSADDTVEDLETAITKGADTIYITADYALTKDFTLPENVWMLIHNGATFTVEKGAAFTCDGEVTVYNGGRLTVNGKILGGPIFIQTGGVFIPERVISKKEQSDDGYLAYFNTAPLPPATSGTFGEGLTWAVDKDYVLTISGSGSMGDNPAKEWSRYIPYLTKVVIGPSVTDIGANAFTGCEALTSVSIPTSVTSIGVDAFLGCNALTNVRYPGSIDQWNSIAIDVGNDCLLEHYSPALPQWGSCGENLKWTLDKDYVLAISGSGSMGEGPAYPWSGYSPYITKVVIEEGVTDVGTEAFRDCAVLTEAVLPGSVTEIKDGAFSFCPALEKINLPAGLAGIGANAFAGCGALTGVTIPGSVTEIGADAFSGCGALTEIVYQGTETEWNTLQAQVGSGNEILTSGIQFNPPASSLSITTAAGEPVPAEIDMLTLPELALKAVKEPAECQSAIEWTASGDAATVDENGVVTFKNAGEVTITAKAVDSKEMTAEVTLSVYYGDKAAELTAMTDRPTSGMNPGETAALSVSGEQPIDAKNLVFVSDNEKVATVDENGVITAVGPGTATISATLRGNDPLGRSVSIVVTVTPKSSASGFKVEGEEEAPLKELYLDKSAEVETRLVELVDGAGNPVDMSTFTYKTSDAKVAKIGKITNKKDVNFGKYQLTIPKNATGACTITATPKAKALKGAETTLAVFVRDYAPRIGSTKLTLNSYRTDGVSTSMVPSYGNEINGEIQVFEKTGKVYAETESERLKASYADDTLTITTTDGEAITKNQTINIQLAIPTDHGEQRANMTVVVKNALPKVTVKQTQKKNLFYSDSVGIFTVTAKDAEIASIEYTIGGVTYTGSDGTISVSNPDGVKKGNLTVEFEGYNKAYEKTVAFATVNAKPTLTAAPTSGTISAEGDVDYAILKIYNKTEKRNLNLDGVSVTTADCGWSTSGEELILMPDEAMLNVTKKTAKRITLQIQGETWKSPITVRYTLTILPEETLPTAKLGKGTLTLNKKYPEAAETELTLNQANRSIDDATFACAKTSAIGVSYENGKVTARLNGGEVKAGSYSFVGTVTSDGDTLKPVKLTVKVINSNASATVKASGKLDAVQRETSGITYSVTVKNINGIIEDIQMISPKGKLSTKVVDGSELFDLETCGVDAKGQPKLKLTLKPNGEYSTKLTYKLRFNFMVNGSWISTGDVSVKVTQSAIKVSAENAKQTVYQSQAKSKTLSYKINLTSPVNAKIGTIEIGKLNTAFRKSLADAASSISWDIAPDGKSATVRVRINDTSKLVSGKTYTLPLVISGEGTAGGASAKINLTLKAAK